LRKEKFAKNNGDNGLENHVPYVVNSWIIEPIIATNVIGANTIQFGKAVAVFVVMDILKS
jgi:hypothetical protein